MKKKILLIGSGNLISRIINVITKNKEYSIKGLISVKKKFNVSYSKHKITNVHFKKLSNKKNFPKIYIGKKGMKDEKILRFCKKIKPDLILVAGWYHLLPEKYLKIAPTYGFHGSFLPNYRGGAPLVWALINGEKSTGVSLFKFKSGIDNGDVVFQEKIIILKSDNIKSIYEKMSKKILKITKKFLKKFLLNQISLKKINYANSKIYPQRSPSDGKIPMSLKAKEMYNFIRAQTKPYPGSFFLYNGKKVFAWKSKILQRKKSLSRIEFSKKYFYIRCKDKKSVCILDWSYEK